MTTQSSDTQGRRERNKQDKLARITDAACKLFAERGIDGVTTQQVAQAADVATGTLFLYAKNKGELLLLAQNAEYATALESGKRAAVKAASTIDAILALWNPIIDCNRKHVENGRAYLREVVFGDTLESNHRAAISLMLETEHETARLISKMHNAGGAVADGKAQIISSMVLLLLSSPMNVDKSTNEVAKALREQLHLVLNE